MLTEDIARSCCGFLRIWRMIILIIWHYDGGGHGGACRRYTWIRGQNLVNHERSSSDLFKWYVFYVSDFASPILSYVCIRSQLLPLPIALRRMSSFPASK